MKRVGVVIVFAEGVDKETADAFLSGIVDPQVIDSTDVHEFDDEQGYPVFYVP